MSLVAMKRLSVLVPKAQRRAAVRQLYKLGCVELEKQDAPPESLTLQPENTHAERDRQTLEQALSVLSRVAPAKKSMLTPRREVEERELFDSTRIGQALAVAGEILARNERYATAKSAVARLRTQGQSLEPWRALNTPLGFTGTAHTDFLCGVLPVTADFPAAQTALAAIAAELTLVGADREQQYVVLLSHREATADAMAALKPYGFARMSFREGMTAEEELAGIARTVASQEEDMAQAEQAIAAYADSRPLLEDASDALAREAGCDRILSESPCTGQTVYFLGWVPEKAEPAVAKALEALGCAWETRAPTEGEDPPTAMDSPRMAAPFGSLTSMYGMPAYGSVIDPNPFMAPFYIVFFGFIMCDAAYGILMFLGCTLALKKMKPRGATRDLLTIIQYCGVSTFLAGVLTGGWFADAVKVFTGTFLGREMFIPPLWFDPLSDPVKMLIFSLVLGAVQMLVGMGMSAWRQIKQGDSLGAFFDIGSWYILFAGIALFAGGALGGLPAGLSQAGMWMAIVGAAIILFTAGRNKKGLGKITGGFGALYGITSYLSDLLSYSRIMALGLSGAVVGQVFNKMGAMGGRSFFGLLIFLAAFLIGHVFNLAISLLGAYVHTTRLQYIEFFGRFFIDGGRPFKPLFNQTKYVDVIREE